MLAKGWRWLASWTKGVHPRRWAYGRIVRPKLEQLEDRCTPSVSVLATPAHSSGALPGFAPAYTRLYSGDFNGDGLDDVAGISGQGQIQVSLSNGTSFTQPTTWGSLPHGQILVGDFSGDHKDDIASFANGTWWVAVSTGTSFITQRWASWPKNSDWENVVVGDFNGDGTMDVAALSGNHTWWIGISNQTGFQTEQWGRWRGGYRKIVVGDFTGNGTDDIAGLTTSGVWRVWLSTGTGFVQQVWGTWPRDTRWTEVVVGDFNGDGVDDIAGLSGSGAWWVGISNQSSFVSNVWGRHLSGTFEKFLVGDFTGAGKDDIAGLSADGKWYVMNSTGSTFQVQHWATWSRASYWINEVAGNFSGDGIQDVAGFGFSGDWFVGSGAAEFKPRLAVSWWNGELAPYEPGAPWDNNNSIELFRGIPSSVEQDLFVNSAKTYKPFASYFLGTLTDWLHEANQQQITALGPFTTFLGQQLAALFQATESYFQARFPGLSADQYKLLMIMNLAHGHYEFNTVSTSLDENVRQLIELQEGCCTQLALLSLRLAQVMGIAGRMVSVSVNYIGTYGPVFAGHYIFYADQLWLDAETNTAYAISLDSVFGAKYTSADAGRAISYDSLLGYDPSSRLLALLELHLVYRFYDYDLKPDVREAELNNGQDGGIIAFYYYYYLAGLGQGDSALHAVLTT